MKKLTIGIFPAREDAERTINKLHEELGISTEDISYLYKNTSNETVEVSTDEVTDISATEGAKTGAQIGGSVGAIAGLAAAAGIVPIIGSIFVAGPLLAALGIAGAIGTTAAGAITGAAAGGLIGALVSLGVEESAAKRYTDRVTAGNILVSAYGEKTNDVVEVMEKNGATDVQVFAPSV